MEYRELGRTGLRVSEIGLGCEGFVGKTEEETQALMTQAVEAGVNWYNKDKREKPVFSMGLSVCRSHFNSFSNIETDAKI